LKTLASYVHLSESKKQQPMKTNILIILMISLLPFCLSCSSEPVLAVSPSQTINMTAIGGTSVISVTTNQTSWNASSDKTWCTVSDKTTGQFTIVVDPNGTAVVRDATVTVNAGKATPVKITLSQHGAAPTLSLSPTSGTIIFSATAKEAPIAYTVTTNLTTWEVVVTPVEATWCKVTRDAGNSRFTIAADPNPTTSPRGPATVTVTAGTALPLQIIVNQRANTSQESEDFGYGDEQKWD
jgi:hypothetical protein